MKKDKIRYVCQECGSFAPKWMGRCPACSAWNSLEEEVVRDKPPAAAHKQQINALSSLTADESARLSSGNSELDRVLGGGITAGSLILLGGDPGIGKSTLLLQVADSISQARKKTLYLSAEESDAQIKMRAHRLGLTGENIYILNEPNLSLLESYIEDIQPAVVIIDSIQTVSLPEVGSVPGSVTQLRECAQKLLELAKKSGRPFFLVGHVTKEGTLAGPKTLEHIVDTVIYFEGDKNNYYRLLRAVKNRFGPVNEVGILEMSGGGLFPVDNPSRIFLGHQSNLPGLSVGASYEGTRAILVEIESLVAPTAFGYPRRMAAGIDTNRLALVSAVLEKRCGLSLATQDIYLKVAGGAILKDPAIDLAIAAAIASSFRDRQPPDATVFIGEIGLSGEIRPVPYLDTRLKEAEKMGFKLALTPKESKRTDHYPVQHLEVCQLETLDQVLKYI